MKTLETIAKRGFSLNGYDYKGSLYTNPNETERVPVDKANRDYLLALAATETSLAPRASDPDDLKADKAKALQMVQDALAGDKDALRSLNAIRLIQVDNYIKAASNFMGFFEIVTLRNDEEPVVQNDTMNEISVGYVAQDGTPRRIKIEPNEVHTRIPLRILTTKRVGYYTLDIYRGDIRALALKTFDLAFELSWQVDRTVFALLTASVNAGGALGTFVNTGNKASRVYYSHSGLITSHLPTTNQITVYTKAISDDGLTYNDPASGIVGRFGVRVIQEIIRYADSWGSVFPSGRLTPTGVIIVPSSDIFAIMLDLIVSSTSAARPSETSLEQDIRTNGYTEVTVAGTRWRFIPDATIPSGTCYPIFNKVPGKLFLKPGMDKEFVFTDNEKNYEERSQQKVVGPYVSNQERMNFASFTYK